MEALRALILAAAILGAAATWGCDRSAASAEGSVTYEVLRDERAPGIKRSLDVRLSARTDEAGLHEIAMQLKAADSRTYPRTFIVYYLPGMEPGTGGWATSHFNPDLEVMILGMSLEREAALAPRVDSRALGTWVSYGLMGAIVTIERSPNGLLMRQRYTGESESETLLKEAHEPQPGRRYHYKEASRSGEHVRINQAGELEFWDRDGLIDTAKKR